MNENTEKQIRDLMAEHLNVAESLSRDAVLIDNVSLVIQLFADAFRKDRKILFCGNGGSAADAQHIAAELSGRFKIDRAPLFAEALHVNSSYLTAVANDYGFDETYRRLVQGYGKAGDILVALSTSGNSKNILLAAEEALSRDMQVIAFTGTGGGTLKNCSNICLEVPSSNVPRIQEMHILLGHIICEQVEAILFPK